MLEAQCDAVQQGPVISHNLFRTFLTFPLWFQDEQFYQATITGMSPTTAVVHFQAYGNYEEVLLGDLRPFQGGGHQQGGRGGRHQGGYHQGGHHRGREIAPTPGLPPAFRH